MNGGKYRKGKSAAFDASNGQSRSLLSGTRKKIGAARKDHDFRLWHEREVLTRAANVG